MLKKLFDQNFAKLSLGKLILANKNRNEKPKKTYEKV